jgi:hypothetical protein
MLIVARIYIIIEIKSDILGKAKIPITGVATKKPKIKENGAIDLIFKVDMCTSVPKGLKPLGESICLVHFAPKTWKKISDKVNDESFFIIQGEAKATNSAKNTPFLEVIAFNVSLKEEENSPKEEKPRN